MTDPNPAQRADWYRTNHEATHTLDARYGRSHRPAYTLVGAGYLATCGCGASCTRADDALLYPTWHDALDAARTNLTASEHGPTAGQEHAS